MSRTLERIVDNIADAARQAIEEHIPADIENLEDELNELDELRNEKESFESKLEEAEEKTEEVRKEYEEMLRDLIRVNIHHAILSPFAKVRELALIVAREIVEAKKKEEEELSTPAATA